MELHLRCLPVAILLLLSAGSAKSSQENWLKIRTLSFRYPKPIEDLRKLDWKNFSYQVVMDQPRSKSRVISLKDGKYEEPYPEGGGEQWFFESISYCSNGSDDHQYAVVRLIQVVTGGSSTNFQVVQLMQLRGRRLFLLGQIWAYGFRSPVSIPNSKQFDVDCRDNRITITSDLWTDSDPHCCPSMAEINRLSFADGKLKLLSRQRIAVGARNSEGPN